MCCTCTTYTAVHIIVPMFVVCRMASGHNNYDQIQNLATWYIGLSKGIYEGRKVKNCSSTIYVLEPTHPPPEQVMCGDIAPYSQEGVWSAALGLVDLSELSHLLEPLHVPVVQERAGVHQPCDPVVAQSLLLSHPPRPLPSRAPRHSRGLVRWAEFRTPWITTAGGTRPGVH